MLIYSMSVSVDGFIADREGGFEWTAPATSCFGSTSPQVHELGGYLCGRRLYETMLVRRCQSRTPTAGFRANRKPPPTMTIIGRSRYGLDTGRRGGPEPDAITFEAFGREIPEA